MVAMFVAHTYFHEKLLKQKMFLNAFKLITPVYVYSRKIYDKYLIIKNGSQLRENDLFLIIKMMLNS